MKKSVILLVLVVAASMLFAGGQKQGGVAQGERPSTWIANRKIVIQAFIDDIGASLPNNQASSPAFQELKKRTGIDLEIRYTPGEDDMMVMAAQLASGTIPDMIMSYLNDSTRPEFPVLLKAAKDGVFADLSGYFAGAKAYNRYLEPNYLPNDTKNNIMWRSDLGGKVYLVHLSIDATNDYLKFDPGKNFLGGPYINEKIANALGVDITKVNTPDDFYNLLVRIKNGSFKDNNGRAVMPLGPKYWGGSVDAIKYCMRGLYWGVSDNYNITPDGKILHEVETDWAWRRVSYMRRLLAEGLMDPEFFTMDTTRALEYYTNNSAAIMGDAHNFTDLINNNGGWIPLNHLYDWNGSRPIVKNGKTGYCAWAVNADTKNPKDVFDLMDYLSTPEGQLFSLYGIEGLTYNMVNNQPRLNAETLGLLNAGDNTTLINKYGFAFGEAANYFFSCALTNRDNKGLFGEDRPGMSSSNQYANAIALGTKYPDEYRLVEGLNATAFLSNDAMKSIKAKMDLLKYDDVLVQAVFAPNDNEARNILNSFKQQLIAAGMKDFQAYIEGIYRSDKKAINFY